MVTRSDLIDLVHKAILDLGGEATVIEVAKEIWSKREAELRASGDIFYTWQYDMRWAAQTLRDRGVITSEHKKWIAK